MGGTPPIEELDVVALREPYSATSWDRYDAPVTLPAGSEGTVVDLAPHGRWMIVEFIHPDLVDWGDDARPPTDRNGDELPWTTVLADLSPGMVALVWRHRTREYVRPAMG